MRQRRDTLSFSAMAFGLCFLAVAALFHDCIGLNTTIFGRDTASHDYGMALWCWQAVFRDHALPLWNPYLFGGISMLGTFAFCPFNLQSIPFLIVCFPLAYTLQYLLAFAIGGMGMALLLRAIGCSRFSSLVGGVLFAVSGHFTTLAYAGHLTKAIALSWTPWVFFLAERWWEKRTWRAAAWLGVPFGFMITASHLQIVYLAGLFLGVWLIMRCVVEWKALAWREVLVLLAQLAFALVLGGLLGSAQLLPGLEMAPISNRASGVTYEEAARTSYPPVELWEYIIPGWIGSSAEHGPGPYRGTWGKSMPERIVSDYFGVLALALTIYTLATVKNRRKWIWAVIALAGIFIGLGEYTPVWRILRVILPGFASFRSPAPAMAWTTIGAVVLVAMGLDHLQSIRRGSIKALIVCAAVSACGMIAGKWMPAEVAGQHYIAVALQWAAWMIGAGGLGLAAVLSNSPGQPARPFAQLVFSLILLLDVMAKDRAYVQPMAHQGFMNYIENATPEIIREDERLPVRLLQKNNELSNGFMGANVGSLHGYHPITFAWYDALIRRIGFYDPKDAILFHQNWLLQSPEEAPPAGWAMMGASNGRMVYQRENPTPYCIVPQKTLYARTTPDALDQVAANAFDPAKVAVVQAQRAPTSPARVALTDYGLNSVECEVQAAAPATLVFCDLLGPGWTARAISDGTRESLPVFQANGAFRGTVTPAGHYQLQWLYQPFSFRLGFFLSLAAAGFLLIMLMLSSRGK